MQEAPFNFSPEALKHISECSCTQTGMQAVLFRSENFEERTEIGEIRAQFTGEFFMIGYYEASEVDKVPKFVIGGSIVAIHQNTLDRLRGKILILKRLTLNRGAYPRVSPEILVTLDENHNIN